MCWFEPRTPDFLRNDGLSNRPNTSLRHDTDGCRRPNTSLGMPQMVNKRMYMCVCVFIDACMYAERCRCICQMELPTGWISVWSLSFGLTGSMDSLSLARKSIKKKHEHVYESIGRAICDIFGDP